MFIDGFDQYKNPGTFTIAQMLAAMEWSSGANPSFVVGRKSDIALNLGSGSMSRAYTVSGNVTSVGFALKFTGRATGTDLVIASITGGGVEVDVGIDGTSGLLTMGGNAGYILPMNAAWYYFEVVIDRSAATVTAYVNGKADVSMTLASALSSATSITVAIGGAGGSKSYDDFYIADSRLGPIQVTIRWPTSDETTQWTLDGTATTHYAAVSPPANPTEKAIRATANGQVDEFGSSTTLPDSNALVAVNMITLARKSTPANASISYAIGSTSAAGAALSKNWKYDKVAMDLTNISVSSVQSDNFSLTAVIEEI